MKGKVLDDEQREVEALLCDSGKLQFLLKLLRRHRQVLLSFGLLNYL